MKFPIARPGSSRENKTGSWRSVKPVLDKKKCIKCGLCAANCPEPCISIDVSKKPNERDFPQTDYDFCKGCGICAAVCPVKAIKMEQEEK